MPLTPGTRFGAFEIYVRAFPGGGRRWQVSIEGGTQPAWNGNSREMFYRNGDRMMSVSLVVTPSGVELGTPRPLFDRTYSYGAGSRSPTTMSRATAAAS